MAKMTKARVERWANDLEKAAKLIARTQDDMGSAKLTTSGAIYANIAEAGSQLVPIRHTLLGLASEDVERSPIHRIWLEVTRAAEDRKARKAAKDAEKAAAASS